jgi:energy-coupling factor transport system permease protein
MFRTSMFHTGTWLLWLIAGAVPAFVLRNPLYLALVLGAVWIVYSSLGRATPMGSSWGSFVKIGLVLLAIAIPFNALSVHTGQVVLVRLPESWPIVGGPVTLEAIIAGAVNGLALLTLLVVFAAFNAVVDHYQLLRATPAFLFQAGVVVSIAITFVPQMVLSAKEIRQAQRIRGHRFRGVRDLLPLVIPLLANGLERAIQLAETMEARGFGSAVEPLSRRQGLLSQVGTLVALGMLLVGLCLVAFFPKGDTWGWALTILGTAALLAVLAAQGRRSHRTRYRRPKWHLRDTAVALACATTIAAVLAARYAAPETLYYNPYPPSSLLPPFNAWVGASLLFLALPALVAPRRTGMQAPSTDYATPGAPHTAGDR